MWTDAEIDHGSTSIYRRRRAIRYLGFDQVLFVFIVLCLAVKSVLIRMNGSNSYGEHIEKGLFRYDESFKFLFVFDSTF